MKKVLFLLGVALLTCSSAMAVPSLQLFIDDHDLTAGVATFYLQYIPISSGATVADVAP